MRNPARTVATPPPYPPAMTPTTTGMTRTRPAVAMLRCARSGSITAPMANAVATPRLAAAILLVTPPLSYIPSEHTLASAGLGVGRVEELFRTRLVVLGLVKAFPSTMNGMADFLVVVGIIGLGAALMGLIWALDHV